MGAQALQRPRSPLPNSKSSLLFPLVAHARGVVKEPKNDQIAFGYTVLIDSFASGGDSAGEVFSLHAGETGQP